MKLIINTPGTYISKSGTRFKLKNGENVQEIPAKKVEQILITCPSSISTEAISLAVEENIDLVLLKMNGKPVGRFWHSKHGSISTIRKKQLLLSENELGLTLVKEWISKKIENQTDFLKIIAMNRRDERRDLINESILKMDERKNKLNSLTFEQNIDEIRNTIQGYEGYSSRLYFEMISKSLPEKYQFNKRSRNPAEDYFNCMLNYGYGILYSQIERSCIISGLDPYIGILHVDNYNRKAFTFDLIEKYRIYIDKIIFKMFSTKKIKDNFFEEIEGGFYLAKDGKQALISEYNLLIESKEKYRGKNMEIQNIIQLECHNIANRILNG
ncbi:CRISPR-associated protein Cas1 [Methanococcus vannielii SB]|uniref:CRISPR-associated endonuclease Cas1 n=1 Tax=Methanococcus vannielii (strain ATCC 35089 / DSM 1224 / JCM 13029 / OCM 148 / SB) TaxID=406327 RepID=A6UNR6_METVS|nr:CRISPR-associated endonuclease Cas1 [Methanococcus vannielii]ABR54138.1 CRISPR-associated protein Cas1 [Methanococcus vannielii SB]